MTNHRRPRVTEVTVANISSLAIVVACIALVGLQAQGGSNEADRLFAAGQFEKAEPLYAADAKTNPTSYASALGLGRIALLRNDLAAAVVWLEKAASLKPNEVEPNALLGEAAYRRDDYEHAAPLFEAAGQTARAQKMRAFAGKTPFLIESGPDTSALRFLRTDPLPAVELEVNGQKGTFLIDTGGWELHIRPAFAEKCGIARLTEPQVATYAGGARAGVAGGMADRVRLGDFVVRHVPVVLPTGPGGQPVDGVIGTVVLSHFIFSLDYPGGQLVLRRKTPEVARAVRAEADAASAVRIPFWFAGTHFMYAWGTANGAGPYLFFIDTGMGGGGFDCPDEVIKAAKIELPKEGLQGMGGGGPVTVYPFRVDLTLGDARELQVPGLHGAIPPGVGSRHGFSTGGLISHAFFRPYVVTFDFTSMTLYMKRTAKQGAADE